MSYILFGIYYAWLIWMGVTAPSDVVNESGFPLKPGCHWTIQRVHDAYGEGYYISRTVLCWTPPHEGARVGKDAR